MFLVLRQKIWKIVSFLKQSGVQIKVVSSHVQECDLFCELKILFQITYMSWLRSLHVVWKKIHKIKGLLLSETRNELDW